MRTCHKPYHLISKQAELLTRNAQIRELVVFHFSPRYIRQGKAMTRFNEREEEAT